MHLALFDLDFTLIPFDSGLAWTAHLVDRGLADAGAHARHLAVCQAFVDGRADVADVHRSSLAPLAGVPAAAVREWLDGFAAAVAARVPAESIAAVRRHRDHGDLCAMVTATSHLIAGAIAPALGLDHVVATRSRGAADGAVDGAIDGDPCWREHKPAHVQAWLAGHGKALDDFERSWFYSDSTSDLPLLARVTHAVAVGPDARLAQAAGRRGWRRIARLMPLDDAAD